MADAHLARIKYRIPHEQNAAWRLGVWRDPNRNCSLAPRHVWRDHV